jgi:hypothetical protein
VERAWRKKEDVLRERKSDEVLTMSARLGEQRGHACDPAPDLLCDGEGELRDALFAW